jgi:integron integrase
MGSAGDSAPDPKRPSGLARQRWPSRVRTRPMSGTAPAPPPPPPAEGLSRGDPRGSPRIPASPNVGPLHQQPKLLDRLREALRARHCSLRTEQTYRHWVKRFIFFHNVRHPVEMAEPEINAFLTHLAVKEQVSASTQNQALSALLFLYRHVLGRPIGDLGEVVRARRPSRLPVVLTRAEVKAVLANMTGDKWLTASLMYGAGLRLMECLRLRIHDVDLPASQIVVRDGKGFKDRVTMVPDAVKPSLEAHLARVKTIHERDLAAGYDRVQMPYALDRKYPNAPTEWEWQFRFPQEKRWVNPRTGEQGRPHVDPAILQRVVKAAAVAIGITKHATCHTLRHSGVYPALCGTTHPAMGEDGYDIRTIQELLGHTDVKTTMIYTHVLNRGGKGVRSPVDAL